MGTPKFTVEWASRWREFCTSLPVVLRRAAPGMPKDYVRTGIRLRAPAAVIALELGLAAALLAVWPLLPAGPPRRVALQSGFENYTVYYVPRDLPNISDVQGAEAGQAGKSGGRQLFHPNQAIRIARRLPPAPALAEAPSLRLPVTPRAADLLALLTSASPSQVLPAAPEVTRLRDRVHPAPGLPVIPPAPDTAGLHDRPAPSPAPIEVIPPAPQIAGLRHRSATPPPVAVVAPPPSVTSMSAGSAPELALSAVPPPPLIAEQRSAVPSVLAQLAITPSLQAGSSANGNTGGASATAVIVSRRPGGAVGIPEGATAGILAMTPAGGATPGVGGHGGSAGVGVGSGAGAGRAGTGTGSGKTDKGYGSDARARGGLAAPAGPGGAGAGNAPRALPGVTIAGGVVSIPSFGSSSDPPSPRHSPSAKDHPPAVVIIATSRSGGGLAEYGVLRGSRVYTTYLNTPQGSVVLQFADPALGGNDLDLTPPQLLTSSLPATLLHTVVSCVLEPTGTLKNIRLLDSVAPELAAAVMSDLAHWRFRPALRGDRAVAVQAILAFGVTTQ